MSDKSIHFEDIGTILFVKNKKVKNLRITVNRTKGVKVTMPWGITYDYAYSFVEQKKDWIRKSILKFESAGTAKTLFKPGFDFSTRYHYITYNQIPDAELKVKVSKGVIAVSYPTEEVLSSANGQELIRKAVIFALRKEAKHYFPLRVEILAKKYGFSYNTLRVKDLKSRWGSCSSLNNINLNLHLMRLPEHLSDYVILHELVHTIHKNHGKHFWQKLDQISGNAKKYAQEMKNYYTQVF